MTWVTMLFVLSLGASGCFNAELIWEEDRQQPKAQNVASSARQQMSRSETADQGSGAAASGGHTLSRVTMGGSYLRRVGAQAPTGSQVNAGLHGNPKAKK